MLKELLARHVLFSDLDARHAGSSDLANNDFG
jgi:hypothetical protein